MALAVALAGDHGHPGVVGEPVESRGSQERIPEDLRPLRGRPVGGEDYAAPLVAAGDDLIEIFRALGVDGPKPEVINDQELH